MVEGVTVVVVVWGADTGSDSLTDDDDDTSEDDGRMMEGAEGLEDEVGGRIERTGVAKEGGMDSPPELAVSTEKDERRDALETGAVVTDGMASVSDSLVVVVVVVVVRLMDVELFGM